jgi:hypothetical protein
MINDLVTASRKVIELHGPEIIQTDNFRQFIKISKEQCVKL